MKMVAAMGRIRGDGVGQEETAVHGAKTRGTGGQNGRHPLGIARHAIPAARLILCLCANVLCKRPSPGHSFTVPMLCPPFDLCLFTVSAMPSSECLDSEDPIA
jgi:hypothetical protein